MELRVYVVRRLILFVAVVIGVMILTFIMTRIIPADPVRAMAGLNAPPEVIAQLRHQYGLDKPVYLQFIDYFGNVFTGNLGLSIRTHTPIWDDVRHLLPATLELSALGFLFTMVAGVLMGSLSAVKKNSPLDHLLRVTSLLGISMPSFWLGLVAILLFSLWVPIFPAGGRLDFTATAPPFVTGFYTIDSLLAGNLNLFWNALDHLLLPALVLGFWGAAWITRHTRSSVLEVTRQDYVIMARAKGLPETTIFGRHILRNGLIPPLTIAGLIFGSLISAAIPIELVFSFSGIGQYILYASLGADFNGIVAVALLSGVAFSVTNLAVDLIYPLVDPRIKYE